LFVKESRIFYVIEKLEIIGCQYLLLVINVILHNFSDLFESEGEMESMESRNEVLRIGFRILHRENIILRRRLREAETENRRLNHLMFTFNF